MVAGIIICHGQLAGALLDAAEKILGKEDHVYAFSNDDISSKTLYLNVRKAAAAHQPHKIVVMVDLKGGSCWTAGKVLARDFPDIKVLSGVNIPMLLSFLSKRSRLSYEELVAAMEEDAHRGVGTD